MKQSTRDLVAFWEKHVVPYAHRSDDENIVMLSLVDKQIRYELLFVCETHAVQLICRLQHHAHPGQLGLVQDFIARVNYWLKTGCFEVDVRDGEISMRSSTFLTDERLSSDQAELLLQSVTRTVAYYAEALHDVLFHQAEPATVLNQLRRSHEQAAVLLQ